MPRSATSGGAESPGRAAKPTPTVKWQRLSLVLTGVVLAAMATALILWIGKSSCSRTLVREEVFHFCSQWSFRYYMIGHWLALWICPPRDDRRDPHLVQQCQGA